MSHEYVIGIDGGATATKGVLFDLDGHEVKRAESGFANFSVDVDKTKLHLESTLDSLTSGLADNDTILHIQMGVAGLSTFSEVNDYTAVLSQRYRAPVAMDTDAMIALQAVRRGRDVNVIMVLGGTGSVIMTQEDNQVDMIGGFGHLLGDEGSGYHLSMAALRHVINEVENGLNNNPLSNVIMAAIGAKSMTDIKHYVYHHDKKTLASLSQVIAKEALAGDQEAVHLLKKEAMHLARQTLTAFRRFKTKKTLVIAFRGGFLLNAPHVKDILVDILHQQLPDFELDDTPVDPVIGAYHMSLTKLDKKVIS